MKEIYETPRLILKVLSSSDSHQVLSFYERNKIFFETYEPDRLPHFYTEAFHSANLSFEYTHFLKSSYVRFWVFQKENPIRIIGTICFHNMVRSAFWSCTVGYKMDSSFCNRGYATEVLSFCIEEIIFKEYGFHRVEALIHPTNLPSLRLAQKVGMEYEGTAKKSINLHGSWEDHYRFAIVNQQELPPS